MRERSRGVAMTLAAVVVLAGAVVEVTAQKKDEKKQQDKMDQAQRQEVQNLVKVVDAAMAGQAAPNDFPISWRTDFLKALEGKTYVPFTLTIDASKLPSPAVAGYLRVVSKNAAAAPAAAAPAKKDDKDKDKDKKKSESQFAFEDIYFTQLPTAEAGKVYRISRAFAVPAGEYDVYVAIKERAPAKESKEGAAQKASVVKQTVTVPDFWTNELTTSTVILAERVDPLTTPPTREQQSEHPYALGATEIVPAQDTKFTKKQELSVIFLIYNPMLGNDKKPNISVEYNFHQKTTDGEKFFNKTNPQDFNAASLPPQFDLAAGHQLVAGQSVPLASFPEGEYRLEIKVTDKNSNKSLTRNVSFTVAAS